MAPHVRPTAGHIAAAILLSLVIAGIYCTIAWGMFVGSDDYNDHLGFAQQLYLSGRPAVPHFLFHALVASLYATHLAPSFSAAGHVVIASGYLAVPLILYGVLWFVFRKSPVGRPSILFPAAIAVLLAQPITLNHAYAIGFFWLEPYHNPTFVVLKPLALAGFAGTAWYVSHRGHLDRRLVALFAIVTAAGALSKPSFLICVLPAVTLLAAYRMLHKLPVSIAGLIVGLYLPAALVLSWQVYATYLGSGAGEYQDTIVWAPLQFMSYWASHLVTKFVLSIAFPLAVIIVYGRQACRDTMLQLAWGCFLIGALYSYTLIEKIHWAAGNFTWSGDITAFTLFAASSVFWLRQLSLAPSGRPRGAFLLCGAVLLLHAISGARIDASYIAHYGCAPNYQGGFACNK